MKRVFLLTLGVMLSSVTLAAQQKHLPHDGDFTPDGIDVFPGCKAALADWNKPVSSLPGIEAWAAGYCVGVVAGSASVMHPNEGVDIIALASASPQELVQIVERYMERHPTELDGSVHFIVWKAMKEAFPSASKH